MYLFIGEAHVENYALQLFNRADNDDREGKANKYLYMTPTINYYIFKLYFLLLETLRDFS
jgi:hypothetical protein